MKNYISEYLGHLSVERGASQHTIAPTAVISTSTRRSSRPRGVNGPDAVTRDDVTAFVGSLWERGLAPSSVERKVAAIKGFHKFLVREGITENHPTAQTAAAQGPGAAA